MARRAAAREDAETRRRIAVIRKTGNRYGSGTVPTPCRSANHYASRRLGVSPPRLSLIQKFSHSKKGNRSPRIASSSRTMYASMRGRSRVTAATRARRSTRRVGMPEPRNRRAESGTRSPVPHPRGKHECRPTWTNHRGIHDRTEAVPRSCSQSPVCGSVCFRTRWSRRAPPPKAVCRSIDHTAVRDPST